MEFEEYGRKYSVDRWILKVILDLLKLRHRFKMKYEQKPWAWHDCDPIGKKS